MRGFLRRSHRGCGCGRAWWPSNLVRVRTTVAGPDPVMAGIAGALDAAQSAGMAGRVGAVITGEGSDPSYKFSGTLAAASRPGFSPAVTSAIRKGPSTLFPSTSGDVRTSDGPAQSIADRLAQLTPQGSRR